jgi:iron complex outermembrane receptor protein
MKKSYLTNIPVHNTSKGWHGWLWGVFMMAMLALPFTAQAQQTISGTVKDSQGGGLPGVSVLIKGTTQGTTTDVDGKYQISAKAGDILVATLTGYKDAEMAVGAEATIDFTLEEGGLLEEVVVTGYTTTTKKDITGSITSLGTKDLNAGPITNPLQQMNGRAAGVAINQVGSEPGVAPNVRIRGITSLIGGNDPLVVIDGIQGNMGLLQQLPPSEIQSIDVLKDASATAVYGSRGAAGVILVTTKKGQAGKTSVEYSGVASVETIARQYEMLTADEYRAEANRLGITGYDRNGNTDWFKEISRTGFTQNHNLALSGGTNTFNYRASITAILQDGIIKNSNSSNYIGRIQATQKAVDNKLTMTYNLNVGTVTNNWNSGAVGGAFSTRPTNPIFNPDGTYFVDNTLFSYTNPYARAMEIQDMSQTNNLFASARAEYEIVSGLTATAFGSWRRTAGMGGRYESRLTNATGRENRGVASRSDNMGNERLFNFILNYRKEIGDHSITATAVYEWQKQIYEGSAIQSYDFSSDIFGFNGVQHGLTFGDPNDPNNVFPRTYKNDRTLVSGLIRANYSFKGKYAVTASMRRDGSSVFGANNKWANFPSFSLAWTASEEEFIKNMGIFDNLKVRAGFGITGNQQGLGPLNSVLTAGLSGNAFFGGRIVRNYAITQNANPNLRWETREMYNAGIDFGILKNKLTGTIDFFYGTTKNLLFDYAVPVPPYPFGSIKANVGTVLNRGLEVTLSYALIDNDDFGVNLGGNFSTIRTRVLELSGSLPDGTPLNTDYVGWGGADLIGVTGENPVTYLIKGQPLGTFNVYRHAGVDDTGRQLIDDLDGNGTIEVGRLSKDRYIAGQALPKFTYAFTPSIRYKKFDLNIVLRGAYGHKIFNNRRGQLSVLSQFGQTNVVKTALEDGIRTFTEGANATDYWLEDGGFTRLENLTLGYNFAMGSSKYVQNVRLSFTTNNLFVITKYSGIDPEVNLSGGGGSGVDYGLYPRTRNFALGLNITLK